MSPRDHIARNDRERARLRTFIARCSDADLARPMPAGWTVAGVLLHAAFWDQRIVELIGAWQRSGSVPHPEDPVDTEWVNDSAKPMLLAVAPRRAADLALEIAERVDALVAGLSDEWVERIAAANVISLDRAAHRGEHLDDLERALGG